MSYTKIQCTKCESMKFKHFLDFKGKNAKIECEFGHIFWTDIK